MASKKDPTITTQQQFEQGVAKSNLPEIDAAMSLNYEMFMVLLKIKDKIRNYTPETAVALIAADIRKLGI